MAMNRLEILEYLETEYLPHALQTWDPNALRVSNYTDGVWDVPREAIAACYLLDGLYSEHGELCAIGKRQVRDGVRPDDDELILEIGDVVWYASIILFTVDSFPDASIAMDLLGKALHVAACKGFDIETICERNIAKLADRKARGVICGKGGDR
jgi:hypothetical protein